MAERWAVAIVAVLAGGGIGLFLARMVWVWANPVPVCSLGPGGHCPGRPPFVPYGVVGAVLGPLVVASAFALVARSLDTDG